MWGAGRSLDMSAPWVTTQAGSGHGRLDRASVWRGGGEGWEGGYWAHSTGIPMVAGGVARSRGSAVSPGLGFLQGGPVGSRLTRS